MPDTSIRDQLIKEAKHRIDERKIQKYVCLSSDDIKHLTKKERIRLAKYICKKEPLI